MNNRNILIGLIVSLWEAILAFLLAEISKILE